jgi:hypothetical protein
MELSRHDIAVTAVVSRTTEDNDTRARGSLLPVLEDGTCCIVAGVFHQHKRRNTCGDQRLIDRLRLGSCEQHVGL